MIAGVMGLVCGPITGENIRQVEAAGRPVSISSCLIEGSDVVCQLQASRVPASDDSMYYVYADEVHQDGPRGSVVATVAAGKSVSVRFPLNYNTPESNLSRKFLIAVKQGGQMVQVSDEHYITNPEAMAVYTSPEKIMELREFCRMLPEYLTASCRKWESNRWFIIWT